MEIVQIVLHVLLYVFAGVFAVIAVGVSFAYYRTRHLGLLLMALAYGGGAGAAILFMQWWPLMAGFVAVWAIRMAGLDPETNSDSPR